MDISVKLKLAKDKNEIYNDLHVSKYTFMQDDLAYFEVQLFGILSYADIYNALMKLGYNTNWLIYYGNSRPIDK